MRRLLAQKGLAELEEHGVSVHVEWRAPYPPPQVLGQYNDVMPDGAHRVMTLTENQSAHRRRLESRAQVFTFIIAMTALVGGIVLIAIGKSAEGLVPLIGAVAGLGGLFAYSEVQQRRRERLANAATEAVAGGDSGS